MKESVFFISVRDKEQTENRKYSDVILRLCREALNENLKSDELGVNIAPHDLRLNTSNLRVSLSLALLSTHCFVVLLDEWENNVFNPNVWFECGVISTISDAKIAFIAKEGTTIPFDVGSGVKIVWIKHKLMDCINKSFNVKNFNADSITLGDSEAVTKFKQEFKETFRKANNPFYSDYEAAQLNYMGFNSLLNFLIGTGLDKYLNPDNGMVKYIDGEEEAFRELTDAVKNAKISLRTSRFAKQSIVDEQECHVKFMNALKDASYRVKKFDRIICINDKEKWLDVWTALADFCPNKTVIYLRRPEYSIKFELVVIDEEISFIHFYLPDDPPGDMESQNDEKIRSTLKIVGSKIGKKMADIFDRLHHRDYNELTPVELSRTLLGVVENEGVLSSESKKHGFLKLSNCDSYYRNFPLARRRSMQQGDAEKAIQEIATWDLVGEDRGFYSDAVNEYFSNYSQK